MLSITGIWKGNAYDFLSYGSNYIDVKINYIKQLL